MAYDDAWLATHRGKMARLAGQASSTIPDQVETPAAKKRRRDLEGPVHMAIVEFLDLMLPEPLKALHFANGEKRDKRAAGRLKAMGLKAGAADIIVLGWMKGAVPSFIWFEVKPIEGGRLSEAQAGWRDWCASIGAPWFLVRSIEDAEHALKYLGIKLKGATV